MTTTDNDARIARLPQWAQALIEEGVKAKRSAEYWQGRADAEERKNEELVRKLADKFGVAVYDTWVSEELPDGDEARTGLGVARPVDFGDSDEIVPEFTVTYRDRGLDVSIQNGFYLLRPGGPGEIPDLRIEVR